MNASNVDPAQVRNRFEMGSELEAPSGGEPDTLEEASEDAKGDSRTRLDAAQADYTDRCLSSAIANLPGGSVLALGLLCGGIILLVTGFFLTRQELGTYVRQHQQPKSDVTFDEMFPSLLYWIAGLAAGLLAYGLLHCIVNVLVTVRVNRCNRSSRKSPSVETGCSIRTAVFVVRHCVNLELFASFVELFYNYAHIVNCRSH
uniref:Transmembrane protein n=1 Tax=Macrostomum lignano TaxID=282301 RepID=A0A1I8JDR4_9PLAT